MICGAAPSPIRAAEPPFYVGDRVRFLFGAEGEHLFATIEAFKPDHQGKPAAVLRIAGSPAWVHLEPLASLELAAVVGALCWSIVERVQARKLAGRCRGCECGGQRAAECLGGFFGQSGC